MKTTAIAIAALIGSTSAFAPQGNAARCKFCQEIGGARRQWRESSCNDGWAGDLFWSSESLENTPT